MSHSIQADLSHWKVQVPRLIAAGITCVTLDGSIARPGSLEARLSMMCKIQVLSSQHAAHAPGPARSMYHVLLQGGWRGDAGDRRSAAARKLQRDQAAVQLTAAEGIQVFCGTSVGMLRLSLLSRGCIVHASLHV